MLEPYTDAVVRALGKLREPDKELAKVAYEYLEAGGKRIRPSVALLTCEAVSGSYDAAIPIALAYELAHVASLTQDDIIDDSPTRHNRPTAHTKHGLTTAILVADMLIFKIFDELSEYGKVRVSKEAMALLASQIGNAAKEAAEGEYLESELSKKSEPTVGDYVRLARLKTGGLFAAAAASGAVVGDAKPRVVKAMREFGLNLGVAFQMTDDILDLTGSAEVMGKPLLQDVQNNASNIVIVHALENSEPRRRTAIRSLIKRSSFGFADPAEVLGLLSDSGSLKAAEALCSKHAAVASSRLRYLPKGKARDILGELTHWLERRKS